jgi:transcription elongation factor Elf1
MEIGEDLKLQEIETALGHLKTCPKCNSVEGFWFGVKGDHIYVQCKCCGASLELFEVYRLGEEREKTKRLRFFRGG